MDPIFINYTLNPIVYYTSTNFELGAFVVSKVNDRYVILPFTDYVMKNSTDPYIAIRSALHQAREAAVQYPANFKCIKLGKNN